MHYYRDAVLYYTDGPLSFDNFTLCIEFNPKFSYSKG